MARKKTVNPILLFILTHLGAAYIRLCWAVTRWDHVGQGNHEALYRDSKPFVYAFWHSRILLIPPISKAHNMPTAAIASEHRDGEWIAELVGRFGVETRRGSSFNPRKQDKNKKGATALKALVRDARSGTVIGMAPDGPKGPRQRAKAGIAQLARLADVPVLPVAFNTRFSKTFDSWDRFVLPLPIPFARGTIVYGTPIRVGRGEDALEKGRLDIESALNDVTETADRLCGHQSEPPEPVALQPVATKAQP
ncbi:lysophospholipid acyltransferase family protein [Parvularcula sp. LCG005]|uniref:lysophospholipid acyltransferase family protein n=1 Tax=Parvularcula sp. LCG005 TaxID=3078805 RepID=UPI002941DE46|nr:lysophospholipid acyltransferase family protein [Parvularcula sp. LCG005]WOI52058.1 lysophospholipid acyltransferase family protein [Parvularcula sp. LCG005]